jgi:hypothetical protein
MNTELKRQVDVSLIERIEALSASQEWELADIARAMSEGRFRSRISLWNTKSGRCIIVPPFYPRRIFKDSGGYLRPWVVATNIILVITIILSLLIALFVVPSYFSAKRSALIYNKLNNTHYTTSDFFWAGDQINTRSTTTTLKIK